MFRVRQPSIQRRLRYAMMTTAEIGLLVTLLFYSFNDYYKSKAALVSHLQNISQALTTPVREALIADDSILAGKILSSLMPVEVVHDAYLIDTHGHILGRYFVGKDNYKKVKLLDKPLTVFGDHWLDVSMPIKSAKGEFMGTLMLRADLEPLYQQMKLNILAALMITVLAIIFAYIVAFRLQRKITKPITRLADHMKKVTVSQIYVSDLANDSNDEIGELYNQFNEMLEQVHKRDAELSKHKEELEEMVKLRTEALNIANKNLKVAMSEANEAKEVALDAAKAKSAFLANMSHEIRTPMNGVLGMLEMMKDTKLDATQTDFLETAYGSADSLLQIINDILDFSKIEAGKLELEKVSMNPHSITEDIATLLASKAREKNIELSCYTDVNLPLSIKGDPVRLRQILTNLLGNAVKFTSVGEVVIRVLSKDKHPDKNKSRCCIRFEVEDTGIGIPADVIPTLFQPFTQADSSTTRKFGGTGLGLSISRQLVELMDGELKVRSEEGKGSCFYFDIEVEISDIVPLSAKQRVEQNSLKGLYALIVDDNSTNRDILKHYLTAWHIDFAEAEDGLKALEKIKDAKVAGRPFQLTYLDMQMPEMDGLKLSKTLANDPELATVKRIMLTSSGPMTEQEKQDACLHEALAKPYRQSQLLEATLEVMALKHDANNQKKPAVSKSEACFSDNTKILLVEDNIVNQKVALAMLGKLGLKADIANNGKEALKAIEKKSYDVALMDCQMPEMSGYEATGILREKEHVLEQEHLPVIAMTANAMEGDKEKCLESGMDDYISKPIKLDILKNMLIKWLNPGELNENKQPSQSSDKEVQHKNMTLINEQTLEVLQNTDGVCLNRSIKNYMTNSEKLVKDSLKLVHHKEGDSCLLLLNRLKTECQKIGGEQLAEKIEELIMFVTSGLWNKAMHSIMELTTLHHQTNEQLALRLK